MAQEDLRARALKLREQLERDAKAAGYNINPDDEITLYLCEGLITNIDRHGYMSCPCRLPEGNRQEDLDVICPCDYRDADLNEYGACYCALYVNDEIARGDLEAEPVPERRPDPEQRQEAARQEVTGEVKVWRCKVCGYLCGREEPPLKCPICKADKERFEQFDL
jgi:ferredoxin-thioredoxin reductase catalytic subunit/rubredoxin